MYDLNLAQKEKCKEILNYFGWEKQALKAIEELAELQQELVKAILKKGNVDDLLEELADVKIMTTQIEIALIYRQELLEEKINNKLERTLGMIESLKGTASDINF